MENSNTKRKQEKVTIYLSRILDLSKRVTAELNMATAVTAYVAFVAASVSKNKRIKKTIPSAIKMHPITKDTFFTGLDLDFGLGLPEVFGFSPSVANVLKTPLNDWKVQYLRQEELGLMLQTSH